MKTSTTFLVLLTLLLSACTGDPPSTTETPVATADASPEPGWTVQEAPAVVAGRTVFQPQLFVASDGALLLAWREKGEEAGAGSNLYLSRRPPGGAFTEPVRINDEPDTVMSWNHDENRPAVALGPQGRLAVAWTTGAGTIRGAVSSDGGASFSPSLQLHQDETRAYRGFVTAAFDDTGVFHAAWIDSRDAEPVGAEEPADLYYTHIVENGAPTEERNLTDGDDDGSVCGCCQPHMRIDGEAVSIVFRNAPNDGYRDIYRLEGDTGGHFAAPARFGPPMWELQGCPSAGPVTVGETTLWIEASTGEPRVLAAAATDGSFTVALEKEAGWSIQRPPRRVAGTDGDDALLLVPGRPTARLLKSVSETWTSLDDDVPEWARTAALAEGELIVVGAVEGQLHWASRKEIP